jgi:environmental stress-induced protein Ves
MNAIRILRAADRHPQPWKNGGGITSEVATFPAGAGMADFDWRISIAEVAEAGPFSCFDGVDRVLAVLDGELALTFTSQPDPVRLTPRSAPFRFAGDVPVSGAPLDGPARDLNVMVRRGRASAKVERIALAPNRRRGLDLSARCILVALGDLTTRIENEDHRLAELDAMMIEHPVSAIAVTSRRGGALIVIALGHPA